MAIRLFIYHFSKCMLDIEKVYLLLRFVIGFPEKTNLKRSLMTVALAAVSLTVLVKALNPQYIAISYIVIVLLAMMLMTKINTIQRTLLVFIAFMCASEIDYFIGAIIGLLPEQNAPVVDMYSIGNGCISLCIIAVVCLLCRYFDISFYKERIGRSRLFVVVEVTILFANLLIMGTIFGSLSHAKENTANVLLIAAMSLSMLVSVISLIFYVAVHNASEYRKLNAMNQEFLRIQREHFTYEKMRNHNLRRFRHDVNNHLTILKRMLDQGNHDQAGKYLEELLQRVDAVKPEIQSGNETIDIVVNEKYRIAAADHIRLTLQGKVTGTLEINDFELCTILGNGLDNAIEACRKLSKKEKWIQIRLKDANNYLRIEIENPVEQEITLTTWKKNQRNHGLGLFNIMDAVEKNGGSMNIRLEEGRFILDILLKAYADIS